MWGDIPVLAGQPRLLSSMKPPSSSSSAAAARAWVAPDAGERRRAIRTSMSRPRRESADRSTGSLPSGSTCGPIKELLMGRWLGWSLARTGLNIGEMVNVASVLSATPGRLCAAQGMDHQACAYPAHRRARTSKRTSSNGSIARLSPAENSALSSVWSLPTRPFLPAAAAERVARARLSSRRPVCTVSVVGRAR